MEEEVPKGKATHRLSVRDEPRTFGPAPHAAHRAKLLSTAIFSPQRARVVGLPKPAAAQDCTRHALVRHAQPLARSRVGAVVPSGAGWPTRKAGRTKVWGGMLK